MEIQTSTVEYSSNGDRIVGFLARPQSQGMFPAVMVIHEIWGLDDHIKDVASRFAREGYVGLAVDLFGGRTFAESQEGQKFVANNLSDSRVVRIVEDAEGYLKSQQFVERDKISVIGFCMGGRYSLLLACQNPRLKASVVFYGQPINREINDRTPRHPLDMIANIRCPILGIYGEADQSIPLEMVNRLRAQLQKHGKIHEIHTYPNVPHAFFNDTRPDRYSPEQAKDAWKKTVQFLAKHLRID